MRKNISLVSFVCLPLLACGGSDSNTKTVKVVDAKVFLDGSGSAAVACKAQATYANAGSNARAIDHAGNTGGSAGTHYQVYQSLLNSTDYMSMLLFAGGSAGAWAGTNIGPAVVDIAMLTELNPQLTIFPMAQFGSNGQLTDDSYYNQSYIAFAGTVNFTAAGGGSGTKITGTLTNVEFDHVLINPTTRMFSDPGDGCIATIASAAFTATVTAGSASFQDGQSGTFEIEPPTGSWDGPRLQGRHL
jgi:hypothetical protein